MAASTDGGDAGTKRRYVLRFLGYGVLFFVLVNVFFPGVAGWMAEPLREARPAVQEGLTASSDGGERNYTFVRLEELYRNPGAYRGGAVSVRGFVTFDRDGLTVFDAEGVTVGIRCPSLGADAARREVILYGRVRRIAGDDGVGWTVVCTKEPVFTGREIDPATGRIVVR